MKFTMPAKLLAATSLLLSLAAPAAVRADDLIVEVSPPANSGHFSTIQAALQHAQAYITANPPGTAASKTFQILVQPGTYTGPITPISNVPIIGSSTANTFINGTGTIITLNGVNDVAIRRFTFQTGTTAISIANSTGINITNNVFSLNRNATAILASTATSTRIANNTFYNNNVAINTGSAIEITNNIFANNNTAISAQSGLASLTYNAFYNNVNKGVTPSQDTNLPNNAHPGLDPRFVDAPNDFHLQADSPCKGSGNLAQLPNSFDPSTSDIGAYGGPFSDSTVTSTGPATVTGLFSTIESPLAPPTVMSLRWTASSNSSVTGYRVYYRTSPAITLQADEDPSNAGFIFVTGTTATLTFSTPVTAPAAPAVTPVVSLAPGDRSLLVSWTPAAGASAYLVYYSTASFDSSSLPSTFVRVESPATSVTLVGLTNGPPGYHVQVLPVAQIKVLAEVTAVIDNTIASAPGTENESARSATTAQGIGETVNGTISTDKSDFPEAVSPYPDLKGKGCFIATAAYGFYSAPQVQVLREFRDRYLMTHAPGRAFVAWYYRHGPRAAAYLNQHPWLKVPVRFALLPLVAMSLFLVKVGTALKITFAVLALGCWGWFQSRRWKESTVQMGGAP